MSSNSPDGLPRRVLKNVKPLRETIKRRTTNTVQTQANYPLILRHQAEQVDAPADVKVDTETLSSSVTSPSRFAPMVAGAMTTSPVASPNQCCEPCSDALGPASGPASPLGLGFRVQNHHTRAETMVLVATYTTKPPTVSSAQASRTSRKKAMSVSRPNPMMAAIATQHPPTKPC